MPVFEIFLFTSSIDFKEFIKLGIFIFFLIRQNYISDLIAKIMQSNRKCNFIFSIKTCLLVCDISFNLGDLMSSIWIQRFLFY